MQNVIFLLRPVEVNVDQLERDFHFDRREPARRC
jgi:hypothetical protein